MLDVVQLLLSLAGIAWRILKDSQCGCDVLVYTSMSNYGHSISDYFFLNLVYTVFFSFDWAICYALYGRCIHWYWTVRQIVPCMKTVEVSSYNIWYIMLVSQSQNLIISFVLAYTSIYTYVLLWTKYFFSLVYKCFFHFGQVDMLCLAKEMYPLILKHQKTLPLYD